MVRYDPSTDEVYAEVVAFSRHATWWSRLGSPVTSVLQRVVTDRYLYSSLAYQGYGRGLPVDDVRRLSAFAGAPEADVVVGHYLGEAGRWLRDCIHGCNPYLPGSLSATNRRRAIRTAHFAAYALLSTGWELAGTT